MGEVVSVPPSRARPVREFTSLSRSRVVASFPTAVIAITDVTTLLCAGVLAVLLRQAIGGSMDPLAYAELALLVFCFPVIYAIMGTYPGFGMGPVEEFRQLSLGTSVGFLLLAASSFFFRAGMESCRGVYVLAWGLSLLLVPLGRAAVREVLARRPWWGEPVVILGAGNTGRMVADALVRSPGLGLKPVALLDDNPLRKGDSGNVPVVGSLELAATFAATFGVQHAIVAMPALRNGELLNVVQRYLRGFRKVTIIPDLFGLPSLWVAPRDLTGVLGLEIRNRLLLPSARRMKRTLDFVGAVLALCCLLPLFILIAMAIKLDSPGPVFYRHRRVGKNGRAIYVLKFRTMVKDADRVLARYLAECPDLREEWQRDQKLKDDPRITRVGKLLRKYSLDELPQLLNVLRGEMSLVGPRPIVEEEIRHYGDAFSLYTAVKPGMTGLWQVSGRNDVSYQERVRLDSYYVRNWSMWLDLYILARTVLVVLTGKGAY